MCCSVNVSVCFVCCVLDSVCELFGETIHNVCGCSIGTVPRCGVNRPGALLERHIVGQNRYRVPVIERVPEPQTFERSSSESGQGLSQRSSELLSDPGGQGFGHDDHGPVCFVGRVLEVGVKRNREIGRNRPRGRGPDQHREWSLVQLRDERVAVQSGTALWREWELDVDRR